MIKEIRKQTLEMVLRLLTTEDREALLRAFKLEQLQPSYILQWVKNKGEPK